MMSERLPKPDFLLKIEFENATTYFYAYRDAAGILRRTELTQQNDTISDMYDSRGAMYFAVAVILIYGVSIALLIGTTLRRSNADYEVKGFLRSYARLDREKKTKEKMKMRKRLIEKNMLPVFPGCSLAAAPRCFDDRLHGPQGISAKSLERKSGSRHEGGDGSSDCVLDLILDTRDFAYIDESPDKSRAHSVIMEENEDVDNKSGPTTSEDVLSPLPLAIVYPEVTVHTYGTRKVLPAVEKLTGE